MSDVAASVDEARAAALAWIAQGPASRAAVVHARTVADVGPLAAPCDPTPRPPICGVTSVPAPRDPPGMSHRAPAAPVDGVTTADVLAALEVCRVAVERMGRRVVSRERVPARSVPTALPLIPELVPGDDVPELGSADDYLPGRDEAVAWDEAPSFCG